MKNDVGHFLLTFDTELAWGHFDCFRETLFSRGGSRERLMIDRILGMLDDYGIVGTWSFVGHLMLEECAGGRECPTHEWRGKYDVYEKIHGTADPLWYGADILANVRKRKVPHEIACHGFTHRTFNNLDRGAAVREMEEWIRAAAGHDIIPTAMVFPRNEVGHLDLIREHGFICYRGAELLPPLSRRPVAGPFVRRLYEPLAAFIPPVVYAPRVGASGMVNLPSSKALFGLPRRMEKAADFLPGARPRTRGVLRGIAQAAAEKKVLHVYAHPYEFRTGEDLEMLRCILEEAAGQIAEGRLLSVGMSELARRVLMDEGKGPQG
jgi:hypothetical protein